MKGMRKIVRGLSFKDLLSYCVDRDSPDMEKGRLIGGNMVGQDVDRLTAQFVRARDQRPDIEKPVWHNALRLPAGEKIGEDRFAEIAADYMHKMGFTDQHPFAVYVHDDAEGQHVHIVASRIGYDGKVYLGKNENLKSTQVISDLEEKWGLKITPRAELDEDGKVVMPDVKTPTKGEIEQGIRTGETPPRVALQFLVSKAMEGNPTITDFCEQLRVAGVQVIPAMAKTSKTVNGLSFGLNGVVFKGSALGEKFKWAKLTKEVSYDEARDHPSLSRIRSEIDAAERADRNGEVPARRAQHAGRGVAAVAADDRQGDQGQTRHDGSGHRADDVIDVDGDRRDPRPDRAVAEGNGEAADGAQLDDRTVESVGASGVREAPQASIGAGYGSEHPFEEVDLPVRYHGPADADGAYDRLLALGEVATPALLAKRRAWVDQHKALMAPLYRITMTSRREGLKTYNEGKSKDGGEKFYTPAEITEMLSKLSRQNARGYDIYLTPIDEKHHHVLVDDVTEEALERLRADGYTPALVQRSSANNYQVVIVVAKAAGEEEQSMANRLVVDLNQRYGDPKLSGVRRPFRMAGFANKKPGRGDAFTAVVKGVHVICQKAAEALSRMRQAYRQAQTDAAAQKQAQLDLAEQQASVQRRVDVIETWTGEKVPVDHENRWKTVLTPADRYMAAQRWVLNDAKGKGYVIDWSRIDLATARILLREAPADRIPAAKIQDLMRQYSPSLADRHTRPEDYLERTMKRAQEDVAKAPQKPPGRTLSTPEC
jgi:hypothetical protein